MIRTLILLSTLCFAYFSVNAQNQAYQIYTGKGKKVNEKHLYKALNNTEYVFFGEYHDDPIAHWLQLEVLKVLSEKAQNGILLSFEMLEHDQQALVDAYMRGELNEKAFNDTMRLWPNHETDYKPLIDFAKEKQYKVIASNAPRPYANLIYKRGWDALDSLAEDQKAHLAPLDFPIDTTLSQYQAIKDMSQHMRGKFMLEAQALKDATMAYFIVNNKIPGEIVYHLNGAFHSDFYQSVVWYVEHYLGKKVEKVTISTVRQEDITKLDKDHIGRADFIICVDEDIKRTH
jgi:uncharacterized iron-regulated protein